MLVMAVDLQMEDQQDMEADDPRISIIFSGETMEIIPTKLELLEKDWHHGWHTGFVPPYSCRCGNWYRSISDLETHIYNIIKEETDGKSKDQAVVITRRINLLHHRIA